jgi:chemotaxis protein methyltransferase CheR
MALGIADGVRREAAVRDRGRRGMLRSRSRPQRAAGVTSGMNQTVWEHKKLTPDEFSRFQDFIYRQTGIRMQEGKITLLSNRIRRRLRDLGLESFDDYYRLLVKGDLAGELEQFIDAITTNETHFFRTGGHFDWFEGPFLEDLVARVAAGRHDRSLRAWSAACSSGEEAYSLAICLTEAGARLAGWRLSVLGTDISEAMVALARRGAYRERALEHVSSERRRQHFTTTDGQEWQLKPAVAKLCEFRRHNLLEPLRGQAFDCIFIRNVLIYFDRGSKELAVKHLVASLAPGGYLVVGPADGIYDMLGDLHRESTFLYRKP